MDWDQQTLWTYLLELQRIQGFSLHHQSHIFPHKDHLHLQLMTVHTLLMMIQMSATMVPQQLQ